MDDLNNYRKKINEIDAVIMQAFEERMKTAEKIALYKHKNGLPIYHPKREKDVLNKIVNMVKTPELEVYAQKLYELIMELSKERQKDVTAADEKIHVIGVNQIKKIKAGYAGHKGSFGEQAAVNYFKHNADLYEYRNFKDVFEAVKSKDIDYGILPVENSSTGSIAKVYDLLRDYGFFITGEYILKICHNLLVNKGTKIEDITHVYSHEQGFLQSDEFLGRYPGWMLVPYVNTATSAKFVKESGNKNYAAIGSKRAAKIYGLEILRENINDNSNNYTRFICVGMDKSMQIKTGKASIVFALKHIPGALFHILECFWKRDINIMKIESRPIREKSWEYFFYLDFDCKNEMDMDSLFSDVKKMCGYFRFLGIY